LIEHHLFLTLNILMLI